MLEDVKVAVQLEQDDENRGAGRGQSKSKGQSRETLGPQPPPLHLSETALEGSGRSVLFPAGVFYFVCGFLL